MNSNAEGNISVFDVTDTLSRFRIPMLDVAIKCTTSKFGTRVVETNITNRLIVSKEGAQTFLASINIPKLNGSRIIKRDRYSTIPTLIRQS